MGRKIVIHCGFHKTATTTVQKFFDVNRPALSDHADIFLHREISAIKTKAVQYSLTKDPRFLLGLIAEFETLLSSAISNSTQDVLISSEDLMGQIPGWDHILNYDAANEILPALLEVMRDSQLFDQHIFYFSTRNQADWIESAYWHLVAMDRMTLSFDGYCEKFALENQLNEVYENLKAHLQGAEIYSADVGVLRGAEFGPSTPLLDLLEIPQSKRDKLVLSKNLRERTKMSSYLAMLEINRQPNLTEDERFRLKRPFQTEIRVR